MNRRPSSQPGGYWLAGSAATVPADATMEWLADLLAGHDVAPEGFPDAPPAFPENAPAQGPAQGYEDSDFASNLMRNKGEMARLLARSSPRG